MRLILFSAGTGSTWAKMTYKKIKIEEIYGFEDIFSFLINKIAFFFKCKGLQVLVIKSLDLDLEPDWDPYPDPH